MDWTAELLKPFGNSIAPQMRQREATPEDKSFAVELRKAAGNLQLVRDLYLDGEAEEGSGAHELREKLGRNLSTLDSCAKALDGMTATEAADAAAAQAGGRK